MFVPFARPYPVRHRVVNPLPPAGRPESADRVERRALAIWPRLDHRALHRCSGNPIRIAAHIAHRTKMAPKAIVKLISDD